MGAVQNIIVNAMSLSPAQLHRLETVSRVFAEGTTQSKSALLIADIVANVVNQDMQTIKAVRELVSGFSSDKAEETAGQMERAEMIRCVMRLCWKCKSAESVRAAMILLNRAYNRGD